MKSAYLKYYPGKGYHIVTVLSEEEKSLKGLSNVGKQIEKEKIYEFKDVKENIEVSNENLNDLESLKNIFIKELAKNKNVKTINIINSLEGKGFTDFAVCSVRNEFKDEINKQLNESPFLASDYQGNLNEKYFGCVSYPVLSKQKEREYNQIKESCVSKFKGNEQVTQCIADSFSFD